MSSFNHGDIVPLPPDRKRLRGLAEAATPGPWTVLHSYVVQAPVLYDDLCGCYYTDGKGIANEVIPRDAAFISEAHPQAVLALLDEIDTAERDLGVLRDRLRKIHRFACDHTTDECLALVAIAVECEEALGIGIGAFSTARKQR